MRLGDLDALEKAMEQADMEAIDYEMLAGMYEHLVRNAPTVVTDCENCPLKIDSQ